MTLTREDSRPLVALVRAAALRTAMLVGLAAAAYWATTTYADDAVRLLLRLGLRRAQVEPWKVPAVVLLVGLLCWRAIGAALDLVRFTHRFRLARAWERQLDDPMRAADVPPLGTHLIQGSRMSVPAAVRLVAVCVLVALGALAFCIGAAYDVLPFRPDEDAVGSGWILAAASLWAIVGSSKMVAAARRAATVERLSSSGPAETAQPEVERAVRVPQLTVRYAGPLHPSSQGGSAGRVLYLRLFDNRAGTEQFVSRWRRHGVVHYLRSADQVTGEELKTWSGRTGDLSAFVDNDAELDQLLAATRPEPGPDGFPAGELLCHGSYWKRAVLRLLQVVDLVVLDLTGFHSGHGGTAFEVRSAIDLVDVDRLRLTAAPDSDQRFLTAQLQRAWSEMAAGSPNTGSGTRTLTVHLG